MEDELKGKCLQPPKQSSWQSIEARRNFFEEYARTNRFDPLQPENWYLRASSNIVETKGASGVLFYHNYSVQKALLDLFPNIGLNKTKFDCPTIWQDRNNRKQFFEIYANENKFNSQDPNNWYSQSRNKIFSAKGANWVMSYHNNSVFQALSDLFPDIGLEKFKFPKHYWNITNLRQFMQRQQLFVCNFT